MTFKFVVLQVLQALDPLLETLRISITISGDGPIKTKLARFSSAQQALKPSKYVTTDTDQYNIYFNWKKKTISGRH